MQSRCDVQQTAPPAPHHKLDRQKFVLSEAQNENVFIFYLQKISEKYFAKLIWNFLD